VYRVPPNGHLGHVRKFTSAPLGLAIYFERLPGACAGWLLTIAALRLVAEVRQHARVRGQRRDSVVVSGGYGVQSAEYAAL